MQNALASETNVITEDCLVVPNAKQSPRVKAAWLRTGASLALPRVLYSFMGHARRSMHYVCSIVTLLSQILPFEPAFCTSVPKLAFNEEGTFKILQLTDLHYGHFPELDEHTDKVWPI